MELLGKVVAAALIAGLTGVASSEGGGTPAGGPAAVHVQAVRSRWPIVREASGRWVVVGEALAVNTGSQPLVVKGVSLALFGGGSVLGAEQRSSAWDLHEGLQILGAGGAEPAGSATLDPGAVAVAYLAAETRDGRKPSRAEVTFLLEGTEEQQVEVPLEVFDPGQRLAWPVDLGSGAWVAVNTPGSAGHWRLKGFAAEDLFVAERFAMDLVRVDEGGRTSDPAGSERREDYYAWGEEILSAGSGTVVAVVADRPDLPIGASDASNPAGNYVVIEHGPGAFGVYAHMMQGSPAVEVGRRVERGQRIGRVGNSGNTSEPHLHVHLADRWDGADPLALFRSQGLPAPFWGARVLRGHELLPLRGAMPLEPDAVVR